jgi:hypothetical protein
MRQAVMTQPGVIEIREVTAPAPGPGEVLLRVHRIGVCGSDIHVYHGAHVFTKYPVVQGHEFSGVIEAVGDQVAHPTPGIRMEHKALILKDDVLVTYPNPIEHDIREGDGGVAVYSAVDGARLWEKAELPGISGNGRGAIIRHTFIIGDTLFLPWAYDLRTGEERLLHNSPLTACPERFDVEGQNFCGTVAAGKNLVAYRSASIGFQEVDRDSGSFWLPELRPSCWISVLPAGGLVLAPEGSSTCICPYNYKTSVALVPVERYEEWGIYLSGNKQALKQFKQQESETEHTPVFDKLHVNLNAPGDRMDAQEQVWMALPRPMARETTLRYLDTPLPMKITGVKNGFRVNADFHAVTGTSEPWLFTSGLEGPLNISIQLPEQQTRRYHVQLLFVETDNLARGDRLFDVVIQGKKLLPHFDILAETGKPNQACVKTFDGVAATGELSIELVPGTCRAPRLCALVVVEDE